MVISFNFQISLNIDNFPFQTFFFDFKKEQKINGFMMAISLEKWVF